MTHTVSRTICMTIRNAPRVGINILKFLHGQFCNSKLAYHYGHASNDAYPLCPEHLPDSFTHIAGECSRHSATFISRHNVACLFVHDAIRSSTKRGGVIHILRLLVPVDGSQTQYVSESKSSLLSYDTTSYDDEIHDSQEK